MYPSNKDGLFGVFVKNFKENLENKGVVFADQIVIKGKTPNPLIKVFKYSLHYLKALFLGIFTKSEIIYIHFLWHHTPLIILLGGVFKRKVVVNIHGSDITKYNGSCLQQKLNAIALKCATKIVVPSIYFSEIVKNAFPNINANDIVIYPSGGINRSVFTLENHRKPQEGVINLGMTSRIDADKGWDIFLKAVAKLRNNAFSIKGFIIGQGNKENEMLKLRKDLNLENEVEFLGLLSQTEIVEHYKKLDVFVFPTALNESLGLVGLEAMSCGLPVIASDIGAPSAYINEGENGFLFETDNVESLTKRIIDYNSLSENSKLTLRKNAISTAMMYDSEKVSANLYQQLLELC